VQRSARSWIRRLVLGALAPLGESHDSADTDEPVVALTFDDGPNPPYTEQLLELLGREGVRATFFMIGARVQAHPDSARAVVQAGHEVGNHSWSHPRLLLLSPSRTRAEIERTDAELRRIGACGTPDFRAPHLVRGPQTDWILWRSGRRHIAAGPAGCDWETQDPQRIAARVLQDVRPGSIIVLHDGHGGADGAERQGTVGAVELVIHALRERGYRFATVRELVPPAC
jgi:peptidoglycan/xylan/chitin deacetylase (PgdA/CDA1 family)